MVLKQISLSVPEQLLKASKEYTKEFGYRNLQEFILDLIRSKVVLERVKRYDAINNEMKAGKKVKKFKQADAIKYLKSL